MKCLPRNSKQFINLSAICASFLPFCDFGKRSVHYHVKSPKIKVEPMLSNAFCHLEAFSGTFLGSCQAMIGKTPTKRSLLGLKSDISFFSSFRNEMRWMDGVTLELCCIRQIISESTVAVHCFAFCQKNIINCGKAF